MLFLQSLADAIDLQSRAIDQDVNRPTRPGCRSSLLVDVFQVLALRFSVV